MGGDNASRGFREVDIAITSVQPGRERFSAPSRDRGDPIYPAYWRNNLTAFSQHANLFFVAVLDQIHVYQPEFPTQQLTKKIFSWTVANSGVLRRGYISPLNPHWINRLVVGDFGTEEVIATAHDEGDFIVCTVRSVCRAIHASRAQDVTCQQAADRCIRYLCQKNVEQSAWGIAIHQNARLLAVSANTMNVTVLAPALVGRSKREAPSNIAERTEDKVYLLTGHDSNIPAIAFCNTIDDPDGRFLVSTDITGGIIVWDIWKQCGLKKIAMSVGPEDAHILGENFLGWSVTCLDPRSFRSVRNDVEFVGYSRQNYKRKSTTIDVSPARKHLRDFQFWHESDPRHLRTRGRIIRSQDRDAPSVDETEDDDNDGSDADSESLDGSEYDEFGFDGEFDATDFFDGIDAFDVDEDDDGDDDGDGDGDESEDSDAMYDAIDFGPTPARDAMLSTDDVDHLIGTVIESTPTTALPATNPVTPIPALDLPRGAHHHHHHPHAPFAPPTTTSRGSRHPHNLPPPPPPPPPSAPRPPDVEFPFAILHSGQRIVTLLHPPFDTAAAVCIDPCHEHLPAAVLNLGSYERLNLTTYMPELGVVVLATQKGRAAVFSLTTLPRSVVVRVEQPSSTSSTSRPNNPRSTSGGSSSGAGRSATTTTTDEPVRHALRLDWVLPFKSQENAEQRPWAPLLGIASAPIQGCQPPHHRRQPATTLANGGGGGDSSSCHSHQPLRPLRFRLFLMYVDNTVLTYEVSREEDGGDQLLVV